MSKPRAQAVPQPNEGGEQQKHPGHHQQNQQPNEPLSGSKSVKNQNHVSHHNPQG